MTLLSLLALLTWGHGLAALAHLNRNRADLRLPTRGNP